MSADILFVKRPLLLPKWLARLRGILGKAGGIGTAEAVKAELVRAFPGTRWQVEGIPIALPGDAAKTEPWFSSGPPQLQFFSERDGTVRLLFASRIEASEIRTLEKTLGVVAIDMQADGLLGMLFG